MARDGTDGFEHVDWAAVDDTRWSVAWRAVLLVAVVALTGGVLAYTKHVGELPVLDAFDLHRTVETRDWLFGVTVLAVALYVVFPLVRDLDRTRLYCKRLRRRPAAIASLAYVVAFFLVGTVGPFVVSAPQVEPRQIDQPPVGTSVDAAYTVECVGAVVDGRCFGTFAEPFGTTSGGHSVLELVVAGAGVSVQVALITAVLVVPAATVVGTTAAYLGGRVDEVLMRAVDLVQTVPAVVVYLVGIFVFGRSLLLLVAVFGLVSWGGVARLVRSEALRLRDAGFVAASENTGAGTVHVLRTHVLRNVSSTVVPAVTLQVPVLILTEAALSFIDLGDPQLYSWGQVIARGLARFDTHWWIAGIPLVFLIATLLAFNVLGDALRDVLDPRLE